MADSNIEDMQRYVKELMEEVNKNTIALSDWQENFITDMSTKIDKYGASPKQRAKIIEIYEQYLGDGGEEKEEDVVDKMNKSGQRRTE